jgi:LacI family transcriptional regulator/LacI family repressor for deo operon, udp, cdd, tsx, nupC, and nupG
MLTALAAYRSSRREKPFRGTLAWLVNNRTPHDWRRVSMYRETFLGAKERAPAHGYALEVFELDMNGVTAARMAGMFRSRNVSGILVCPQPQPNTVLDFSWHSFSSVTFGHSLISPQLHTIISMHLRSVLQVMHEIRKLGYSRIGLVYSRSVDTRVSHAYLGGFLSDCHLHGVAKVPPPVDPSEDDFHGWFRKYRPDAIVSAGIADITQILADAGLEAPADVGVAIVPLPERSGAMAGMYENSRHIGALAVDLVVGMIQQGVRGSPDFPHYTHVDAVWVPGRSLPPCKT